MTKQRKGRLCYALTMLLCGLSLTGCVKSNQGRPSHLQDGLDLYRTTNDQGGHEFVKTEQFLVPVGAVVVIQGLQFEPGISTLTPMQERIVQQVFNSIEEITENTVGDINTVRVAEFKKMQFEIHGYPDRSGGAEARAALSEARARAVLRFLTHLGTPAWRLTAKGVASKRSAAAGANAGHRGGIGTVEFVRTR